MMTTAKLPLADRLETSRTVLAAVPVCGCGQDLDSCAGRHCPRCGRTLSGRPVAMTSAA